MPAKDFEGAKDFLSVSTRPVEKAKDFEGAKGLLSVFEEGTILT